MVQIINKESAYLASIFSGCSGAVGMYLLLFLYGVPNSNVSPEVNAAFMAFLATVLAGLTIGFIEDESRYK